MWSRGASFPDIPLHSCTNEEMTCTDIQQDFPTEGPCLRAGTTTPLSLARALLDVTVPLKMAFLHSLSTERERRKDIPKYGTVSV